MTKKRPAAGRAQRGETLIEVLISLLVVVLATLMLASMATGSAGVDLTTHQKDEQFNAALEAVEKRDGTPVPAKIQITPADTTGTETPVEVDVQIYTEDYLTSYAAH